MTAGMPLVFATPKKTGLDPALYRVTHAQFPPKYLRILQTSRNELAIPNTPNRWPAPTATISVQPPAVSRQNVAVLQPGPAKHSYQVNKQHRYLEGLFFSIGLGWLCQVVTQVFCFARLSRTLPTKLNGLSIL